jgi:6-phosphogluconolactonase
MTSGASLRVHETTDELHRSVAEMVVDVMGRSLRERGVCILALSGGETPRPVYHRLGSSPLKEMVDWGRVHLLCGDERMVPPEDPQSNYRMVERELVSRVPIPPENVHWISGEKEPAVAAREYESDLQRLLSEGRERMDLVLLGLGEDGHTASLFPESPALKGGGARIRAVFVPQLGTWRVTMTLPLINAARRVVFVVTGKEKAGIVRRILREGKPSSLLPASLIQPRDGELVWMIDREAASELI